MSASNAFTPRKGLDHDWFAFRTLQSPSPLRLEEGKRVALTLVVPLQFFPLDAKAPFAVPGALERPYPDIGTFSQREIGLGDGLARLADLAHELQLPLSFVVERQALHRLGARIELLRDGGHAVLGGGEHAVHVHTAAMQLESERAVIRTCLAEVRAASGREVTGWRSPYCSQSPNTLSLLGDEGVRYVGDFACDDRPFQLSVGGASLWSVPMNHFYSDLHFMQQCRQSVDDYAAATLAAAACLVGEPTAKGSILSLVLHPWLSGVTHRIKAIERMLRTLRGMPEVQWLTTDQIHQNLEGGTP